MPAQKITLKNTLSKKLETFVPIKAGEVSMYHCGPTVYNYLHIGNLRAYVLADLLRRMFEANGYKVKQVINITDVGHLVSDADDGEDKVEKMAEKSGKSAREIADFYTDIFMNDIAKLNIKTDGTIFPKASEHIKEQIEMIQTLEHDGHTYITSDGVYFDTSTFKDYGKLGNIDIEGLKEGARVEVNTEKRHATDFALWKFSPKDTAHKRYQEWDSPWGVGFPGWHIECSAMSSKYLGETFDVHTGGIDHIPVHHNNEIAQSESAHHGAPLAHYWLHGAFVNVADGKMSKSKENFLRLETLEQEGIHPMAYRYWLLSAHYSTQVDFSLEAVHAAQNGFKKLLNTLITFIVDDKLDIYSVSKNDVDNDFYRQCIEIVSDDLATPKLIAEIFKYVADKNIDPKTKLATIIELDRKILGLNIELEILARISLPEGLQDLITQRRIARENKDWKLSDELRDKIIELGYEVKDTESGQEVYKKL